MALVKYPCTFTQKIMEHENVKRRNFPLNKIGAIRSCRAIKFCKKWKAHVKPDYCSNVCGLESCSVTINGKINGRSTRNYSHSLKHRVFKLLESNPSLGTRELCLKLNLDYSSKSNYVCSLRGRFFKKVKVS